MMRYLVLTAFFAIFSLSGCTTEKRGIPDQTGPDLMHQPHATQQKLCEENHLEACIYTSLNQLYGREVPENRSEAEKKLESFLKKVTPECEKDNGYSCYLQGLIEVMDQEAPDRELLKELFDTACEHKIPHGCFMAGMLTRSTQQQDRYLKTGCYLKNGDACSMLGSLMMQHRATLSRGITQLQDTCSDRQMHSVSCTLLGEHYKVQGDIKTARSYYLMGCKQNDPTSCIFLGITGDDIDLQTINILKGCQHLIYQDYHSTCLNFDFESPSLRREVEERLKEQCQKEPHSWSCNTISRYKQPLKKPFEFLEEQEKIKKPVKKSPDQIKKEKGEEKQTTQTEGKTDPKNPEKTTKNTGAAETGVTTESATGGTSDTTAAKTENQK